MNLSRSLSYGSGNKAISRERKKHRQRNMKERARSNEEISFSRSHCAVRMRRGWAQEKKTRPGRE